ncbi:MAG: rRNA maturation RNase YbeY [Agarilytica sp.]
MINADIQLASDCTDTPNESDIILWVESSLKAVNITDDKDISVRIIDEDESRQLNRQYRNIDKSTNVLSFPCDLPEEVDIPLLGDLAICSPVVAREAKEQGKALESHWAHMVVHGTLHLLGFDHIEDSEAEHMESIETSILTSLGYAAPYEQTS